MIAKPASSPCPKCNKDQQHTKGLRDCEACRGEGFVLSKMTYPPERTLRSERQPSGTPFTKSSPRPKKKPDTSFMMSDGTGIHVIDDELFYRGSDGNLHSYPPPNRLWQAILSFIDWLNRLAGAEKPKEKTNSKQMATLNELFEPIIKKRVRPIELYTQIGDKPIQQDMAKRMIEDAIKPKPPRPTFKI